MKPRIFLSPPHQSGNELLYIQQALEVNWIAPAGPGTAAFENMLSAYTGCKHVVALSSGTAAIHLALLALHVAAGDIVLCQSLTFAACANPIVYQKAIPVFIDSEEKTWNICPDALEESIRACLARGQKPKAIIAVHLYGMPMQLTEILKICERYDIPLIEDAAEALGSFYKNQHAGSFGRMGVLSFNGNKIITTSAGGALLSNDEKLIEYSRFLSTQAKNVAPHYEHTEIGYNYRMSNICASIGLAQMEVIVKRVERRRFNFDYYKKMLADIPAITFQNEPLHCRSNRWLTAILIDPKLSEGITREVIRLNLEKENIESRPVWKPMHLQPVFHGEKFFGAGVSERLFENGLCLPSGSDLSLEDINRVTEVIKKSFR